MEMDAVTLLTEDSQQLRISRKGALQIGILQPMLKSSTINIVPVPTVKSDILSKVIEFVEQHQDDIIKIPESSAGNVLKNSNLCEEYDEYEEEISTYEEEDIDDATLFASYVAATSPWDQRFLDAFDLPTLVEVTKAANYLNIPNLLDLCCRTIAKQMTGLKASELRRKFNLPNDFTPEEEARMAAEFSWID